MFSVLDNENNEYLHSGRNSKTKEEAINEAFDLWRNSDGGEFNETELNIISKDKENWINGLDWSVVEHKERLSED